jgi:hypothetical protein
VSYLKAELSTRQHGFIKGQSTVTAARHVLSIAEEEKGRTLKTRKLVALVTIDVRNAFNSASWRNVVREREDRKVSDYLIDMVKSYFSDRCLLIDGENQTEVTAGVPQGSVLGPLLWNLLYHGVLNISLPDGAETVAYADDLALVVTAKRKRAPELKTNAALEAIQQWMGINRLEIAPEKTEAVLLIGRKKCGPVKFVLGGEKYALKSP